MYYYRLISSMLKAAVSTLLTSLYAVYKAESNANDSLGNYNGIASGGVGYTTGKSGNAWFFNAANGYITLPDNFKLSDSGANAFSISLWCYMTDATGAGHGLFTNFMQNAGNGWGWMLWYYQSKVYFTRRNGTSTSYDIVTPTTVSLNSWHHIVATRKNGATKLYIDGTLVASDTSTVSTVYTTTHYPLLGARQSYITPNHDWFLEVTSKIDEVSVWNKELTSTEVTELYNAGTGKFYPY